MISTPAYGSIVSSLTDIALAFNGNVKKHSINANRAVTMSNGTNTWDYVLEDLSTEEDVKIIAKPVEECVVLTEVGEYTLTIEAGAISLNSKPYGYELHFTISTSGIEDAKVELNNDAKIYNFQSIEVNGNNIPAGIYIKDNKKVLIR